MDLTLKQRLENLPARVWEEIRFAAAQTVSGPTFSQIWERTDCKTMRPLFLLAIQRVLNKHYANASLYDLLDEAVSFYWNPTEAEVYMTREGLPWSAEKREAMLKAAEEAKRETTEAADLAEAA